MNMEQKQSIAWHVPNLLSICIDSVADGEMSGEIYHCYKKEPLKFSNIIRMIETADKFFDQIKFPQSATQIRSFEKKEPTMEAVPEKVCIPQEVLEKRGAKGTFLLNVKYRQNSSWQGVIQWVEGDLTYSFSSVLELLKILSNVMQ
ncbi:hypothetical protein [Eubacterium ramulus]|jgi:Iap family predicted aminopeptidase|uniref:hypothetical protein n=2 Tax=Bacillota TaxID=1239 RepID=UPI001FA81C72|nr:hypothetical protein [Eubacterium ramulus]